MAMRRREFIAGLGGVAAWPAVARGQQPERIARIGYLAFSSATQGARFSYAFREGLRDLGYVEGKNVVIESRNADGDNDRLPDLATELVSLNVDVIVTYATGVTAAQRATRTIPIVMATYADAVAVGVVTSVAHPGGNVTGLTFFLSELMAKRLELLKEVVPSMTRAGVFLLRGNPSTASVLQVMGATANALNVGLQPFEISTPTEFESAFSALAEKQISALVVVDHAFFIDNADAIAALAARRRVPSAGPLELAASGGLMAYGVNFSDMFRRAAVYVDRILKGTNPGDIPIEQAAKFLTTVNLKTAKAIGIDMPTAILLRADEVIE
jgi:putative tryptophan/tyrosine transport system substrate-binding protein